MSRKRSTATKRKRYMEFNPDCKRKFFDAMGRWENYKSNKRSMSPFQAVQLLEGIIKDMLEYNLKMQESGRILVEELLDYESGDVFPNRNKRWDDDDDEFLIQHAASGDDVMELARALGRTPAAIATRLSTLIGIPRSEFVEKYLDGELDGEEIRGLFKGKMRSLA